MADPEASVLQKYGINPNQTMANPASGGKFGGSSTVFLPPLPGGGVGSMFVNRKMSAAEAQALPLTWYQQDPQRLRELVNTGILRKVPGFDVGMGLPEIMNAWNNLLQSSWEMSNASKSAWTPFDVLDTYSNQGMNYGTIRSGDWEVDARTGERLKYVGPKSKTTKDQRIDLSSPEDAKALTTQMLSQLLGRNPTAEEVASYKSSINAAERKNPVMAETTVTLDDMGEQVSSATVTSGGLSAEAKAALVEQQVKKGKEYGEFQSATTVQNWLMRALGMG